MPKIITKIIITLCITLAITQAAHSKIMATKNNETNVRSGPGTNYPIVWILKKKSLPLKITAQYERWNKIKDWQGQQGWIHKRLLNNTQNFIVTKNTQLHFNPNKNSPIIAQIKTNITGQIIQCKNQFCLTKINHNKNFTGWINKNHIWGACPNNQNKKSCPKPNKQIQ